MGKQLLTIILILSFSISKAQFNNINIDQETTNWVYANIGVQTATELAHNWMVDSIKKKQSKLMAFVNAIAAEKEFIIQTYKNVSGFKKETKYYISMAKIGADIIKHSAEAVDVIGKSKLEGKAMAILNVSNLVTNAISLGTAFSDIVANSEVPNPLKQAATSHKDKHNLLNRYERINMANDILNRLRSIDSSLRYIIYLAKNSGWKDLLFKLDRKTYTTYIMTKVNTNEMISKWNRISK